MYIERLLEIDRQKPANEITKFCYLYIHEYNAQIKMVKKRQYQHVQTD
jgi:hypothetical protein